MITRIFQRNMGRDGETLIVVILDDNSLQNHANGIKDDDDSSSSDDDDNERIKIDNMISMTNKKKPKDGRQVANKYWLPNTYGMRYVR